MPIISSKLKKESQKAVEAENKRREEEEQKAREEADKKAREENEKKEKNEEERKMRHILKKAKRKAKHEEEKASQMKLERLSNMRKELALMKRGSGAIEVKDENGIERAGFNVVRIDLADGNFSKVYKAKKNPDIELAVKLVTMDKKMTPNYLENLKTQSCKIMRYVGSSGEGGEAKIPQLAKVYEIFMTPQKVYVFMDEYMPITIQKRLKAGDTIDQVLAKKWSSEVAKAVNYLHSIGVAHRGVRADNVIFDKESQVKLIGLGYACIFWDSDMEQVINQKKEPEKEREKERSNHFPPEAFQADYDPSAVDVLSWGALVCQILTKHSPFDPKNDKIEEQWSSFSESHTMEEGLKALLARCFESDVSKRIKMQEIILDAWIKQ